MVITAMTKKEFESYSKQAIINYAYHDTKAGTLLILSCDKGIFNVSFVDEKRDLMQYIKSAQVDTKKLLLIGTPFQHRVWKAALEIRAGNVVSYQDLATRINAPKAFRAVANALGQNKVAYFVPCHRILRKSGDLGGYYWGVERKALLLQAEQK